MSKFIENNPEMPTFDAAWTTWATIHEQPEVAVATPDFPVVDTILTKALIEQPTVVEDDTIPADDLGADIRVTLAASGSEAKGEIDQGKELAEQFLTTPGLQFALYGKYTPGESGGQALVRKFFHTTSEGLQKGAITWEAMLETFEMGWLDRHFQGEVAGKAEFEPAIAQWHSEKGLHIVTLAFSDRQGNHRQGNHSNFHVALPFRDRGMADRIVADIAQTPSTLVHLLQMVYNRDNQTVQGDRSRGVLLENAQQLAAGQSLPDRGIANRRMGRFDPLR